MNFAMGLTDDSSPRGGKHDVLQDGRRRGRACRPADTSRSRPQMGYERHCGSGFELVLDVMVPELGRELVQVLNVVSQVVKRKVDIPVRRGWGRSKIPRGVFMGYAQDKVYWRFRQRQWWSILRSNIFHPHQQCFKHQRLWCSLLHPHQQWCRQRLWWSMLHPRQQLFLHQRLWWIILHPHQRCPKRQRQ